MDRENQRPNPVEDYINQIVSENDELPAPGQSQAQASADQPASRISKQLRDNQNPITERAFQQRRHMFDPTGHLEELDANETKVADVRRHPFGLMMIYAQFFLGALLSVGLIAVLLPAAVGDSTGTRLFIGVIMLVLILFGVVFLALATRIYRGNQLIVTDLNITEVHQIGLFDRRVSELSLANVEDVSADTHGIFSTMFNYGTLTIETAGEAHHFIFKYCPYPNAYAKAIQDVRSDYLRKYGGHSH
ncbi:MAG TPA: PH domain-containing protein [Candidatus Saccharimonadales bacterium]|nr:PH domain-containing protein [Candidatus Saccharimonadales bacterium]